MLTYPSFFFFVGCWYEFPPQLRSLTVATATELNCFANLEVPIEEEDDDDLAEIDSNNIIQGGRRTRGKQIDFAAAAKAQPAGEDDSEDDEDFVAPEDKDVEMH